LAGLTYKIEDNIIIAATMKTTSAALLALLGTVAAESCPDELPGNVELVSGFALHYGILETDQALCGKLVSNTEAWVGFAAQPEGVEQMVGARSIIALPSANTVQQYMLNAKSTQGIFLAENQSLTETSVTQEDGTTVARFKQLLSDDGFELTSSNVYLMARGTGNDLGYHANRGFVALDFENNIISSSTGSTEAPITTAATESSSTTAATTEAPASPTPAGTSASTPAPTSAASLQKIGSVVLGSLLWCVILTSF
jgi:hypothetical protein